ncbi:Serine/threonine protein kinase [Mycena chlorophos]|uniref:Serine/threonine protein kinase n=1 Tax=Mycena chlorophos TaxID=658473 RepID=A0A8H6VUW1_MYCCL|nr:Serine/threonine protein kinase [Mycena chlorophos]
MPSSSNPASLLPDFTGLTVDRYNFVRVLGSGAFGKVYLARDTSTGDHYAVKCMVQPDAGTQADIDQEREIALHYAVHEHTNVVSFVEHFTYQGYVFVIMEYVQGGDLLDAIERGLFHQKPELVKTTITQVLDAVEFLHKNGIFHRDIKPQNILCNEDGSHPRLTDFGFATQSPISRRACGTPAYVPPESFEYTVDSHSPRAGDMWALAVLLLNLVIGRQAWDSAEHDNHHYAMFLGNEDYLESGLGLSAELSALLKRCFDEDATRRPTLAEMRRELDSIEPLSDGRLGPQQAVPPPSSSRTIIEFDSSDWDEEESESGTPDSTPPATPPMVHIEIAVHVEVDEKKTC